MTDLIAVVETTARDPLTGAFALIAVGGLKIEMLEDGDAELQDLVLTVHHCFMLSLMNTHALSARRRSATAVSSNSLKRST